MGYLALQHDPSQSLARRRQEHTARALAMAKEAIISWSTLSATHTSAPGLLPCPEDLADIGVAGKEGEARSSCVNHSPLLGRLPWRTLKLPPLIDGYGEPLWLAISPGFRYPPINSQSPGKLFIGTTAYVAIVIAPGPALPGQQRRRVDSSNTPKASDYLEGKNADGDLEYSKTMADGNDIVLGISAADLFHSVEQRVLGEVGAELWRYYCGRANTKSGGGCLSSSIPSTGNDAGVGRLPEPAAISDSSCLGSGERSNASGQCLSQSDLQLGRLPMLTWPVQSLLRGTTTDSGPSWFQENGWRELIFYAPSRDCVDVGKSCPASSALTLVKSERSPAQESGLALVLLAAGPALSWQSRGNLTQKTDVAAYLEGNNAISLPAYYQHNSRASTTANDQARAWLGP